MKRILYISIVIILVSMSSCVSTKFLTIDVYEPATYNLDSTVVNVVIVNNTPVYKNSAIDSLIANNNDKYITHFELDSIKNLYANSLAVYMDDEKYFNKVNLANYQNIVEREDINIDMYPLKRSLVRDICQDNAADALISIDHFYMTGKVEEFYQNNILSVNTNVLLRLYKNDGSLIQNNIIVNDTVYWTSINYYTSLPPIEQALKEATIIASDKTVNEFIPHWKTVERFYFIGINGKADKAANKGDWKQAALLWKESYDKENKVAKIAQIALNIAFANECMDDIENAKIWIDIAKEMVPKKKNSQLYQLTIYYEKAINERLKLDQKIRKQIGN